MEADSIHFGCIKFAGTVAIDGVADMVDEFTQLRVVRARHHRARRAPLRFTGHKYEATHELTRPQRTLSAANPVVADECRLRR